MQGRGAREGARGYPRTMLDQQQGDIASAHERSLVQAHLVALAEGVDLSTVLEQKTHHSEILAAIRDHGDAQGCLFIAVWGFSVGSVSHQPLGKVEIIVARREIQRSVASVVDVDRTWICEDSLLDSFNGLHFFFASPKEEVAPSQQYQDHTEKKGANGA
jgi:hypothetical protein